MGQEDLHPAVHPDLLQTVPQHFVLHAEKRGRGKCRQRVVLIEMTRHADPHIRDRSDLPVLFSRALEGKGQAHEALFRDVAEAGGGEIRFLLRAEGADSFAVGSRGCHFLPVLVVSADQRGPALGEQGFLPSQVLLETPVFVGADVVRGDIRENSDVEPDAAGAVKHESLAGDLHHRCAAALLHHVGEGVLDLIGFRRRVFRRRMDTPDGNAVRSDQSGFFSALLQQLLQHVGRRGLSLGPRHTHREKLLRREVKPGRGQFCQSLPGILRADHGDALREFAVPVHGHRPDALLLQFPDDLMGIEIRASHTDKEAALLRLSGIIAERGDVCPRVALKQCVTKSF